MSGLDVIRAIHTLDAAIAESGLQFSDNVLNSIADLKRSLVGEMQFAVIASNGQWLWKGEGFDDAVFAFNKAARLQGVALMQVITISGELKAPKSLQQTQHVFRSEHAEVLGVVTGDMWTDPSLQFPLQGNIVLILGSDDSVHYGRYDYDGWSTFPGSIEWSNTYPRIVGWKYANWPANTDEEQNALTK